MFFAVVIFMFFIMAAALVMLWMLNRNPVAPGRTEKTKNNEIKRKELPTYRHIGELINIKEINSGIIYANGKYLGLARIEGTNFSVLSGGEQDIREEVLIDIQNQTNYPTQYITSTIVSDTNIQAEEIRKNASVTANTQLANYMNIYAASLADMKTTRRAMTQVSWLVISDSGERGNPISNIREKMALLQEALRARAGIILTPITTNEEVIDTLQQIMLPEKLSRPSEMALLGGLSPIKFNIREIENIA